MVEVQLVTAEVELLRSAYAGFNAREIETVLAMMHDNVDWPNGMKGGRVVGKSGRARLLDAAISSGEFPG